MPSVDNRRYPADSRQQLEHALHRAARRLTREMAGTARGFDRPDEAAPLELAVLAGTVTHAEPRLVRRAYTLARRYELHAVRANEPGYMPVAALRGCLWDMLDELGEWRTPADPSEGPAPPEAPALALVT
jgi:hypothetical protein